MLLQPRQDNFPSNMNSKNVNLLARRTDDNSKNVNLLARRTDDNSALKLHALPGFQKCYSPRPGQRPKVPPNISIRPTEEHDLVTSHYLSPPELDNDVFKSHTSQTSIINSTSAYTEGKQEVYSGKLFIIRNTGSAPSSRPTSMLRSSSPCCDRQRSPARSSGKTAVMVRVYRCHLDHFAVISRDLLFPGKPVFVNLRHSRVIPGQSLGRFVVVGKGDSGHVIEFETPDLSCLGHWLDVFQAYTPPESPNRIAGGFGNGGMALSVGTPPIPRSPALPTLAETDEN